MLLYEKEFLRNLQFSGNYSKNTLFAYKRDLKYYALFCENEKKPLKDFFIFLNKKKLSPRSQARVISCLRTYFHFLQKRGESCPQIKQLKLPKARQSLPEPLNVKEFQALWKVANKDKSPSHSLRNELILSFLYVLGCRVSELISINTKDFNETEAWICVLGKGDKQRLLPLTQRLQKMIAVYLTKARPLLGNPNQSCLFFNNKGNRPSRVDIWRWLKKWSLQAGLNRVKSPHSFRHGCASSLLEKGADLISIQKLLGHSNIQTTQIYTSINSKNLKQAIKKHHPLSGLKKI